jgi:hypothetical protein
LRQQFLRRERDGEVEVVAELVEVGVFVNSAGMVSVEEI